MILLILTTHFLQFSFFIEELVSIYISISLKAKL